MPFAADIPHFYCLLRAEYAYDLKSHQGEFIPVQVFGVDSVPGHAIGFDVLTDFGSMFARLPICALCWKKDAPALKLEVLELWDNFSADVEAHEYSAIRGLRVTATLRDRERYEGSYMFTLSWKGSAYAEQPGEGGFKRAHVIKLDNGCFAAQPNNRIQWREPSFVTKPFPEKPDFKTNSHVWSAERTGRWMTSDDERFYYDVAEA